MRSTTLRPASVNGLTAGVRSIADPRGPRSTCATPATPGTAASRRRSGGRRTPGFTTTTIGFSAACENSVSSSRSPRRESNRVGSTSARATFSVAEATGAASTAITASVATMNVHGRAITARASRSQKCTDPARSRRNRRGRSGPRSTRGPSIPRMAGRSVTAAKAETATTRVPPAAIDDSTRRPKAHMPESPITTARPENAIDRPAVSTVRTTAASTSRPARSSSRKRETARSA